MDQVSWTFATVADMQAETRIVAGDLVQTAGYRAAGDGGTGQRCDIRLYR